MHNFNHRQLILAREMRGLTQRELVEMVPKLNQGNYSKMEKGLLGISKDTLSSVAEALNFPLSFFYKSSISTPIASFYYRKKASMTKKQLSALESRLDFIRMAVDDLVDSVSIPCFDFPQYKPSKTLTPSEIAVRIRDFLRLPRGPIHHLVRTLESCGIIIYFLQVDNPKFDGITLLSDKGQPIIVINDEFPNDRKRFTIIHELGHLVMHIPFSPIPADRDEEEEANEFVGEFSMPYSDCRGDLNYLRSSQLDQLKSYWKMSKAAIISRAFKGGFISKERRTNMMIELSKSGERKSERGYVELDSADLMDMLIKAHEENLNYSLEEMEELLGLKANDYLDFFRKSIYRTQVQVKAKNPRIIALPSIKSIYSNPQ